MHGNEKTLTFSTKNSASKKDYNNLHLIFKMANTTITPIGSINQNPTSLGLTPVSYTHLTLPTKA